MVKIVRSEFIKICSLKVSVMLLIVFALVNAACIIGVEKQDAGSWKANAEKLYIEYGAALEECRQEGLGEEFSRPFAEKRVLIGHSIEQGIPYGVTSVFSHMLRVTELLGLPVILAVCLGNKVYSNEYDAHTWKNLFCTGTKKRMIYLSKLSFTFVYMAVYMTVFLLVSAAVGIVCFGGGNNGTMLSYVDGQVLETNMLAQILIIYGMSFAKLMFYVFLAHVGMIFTGQKLFSFLGVVVIMITTPWINMLFADSMVLNLLPFRYLNMGVEGFGFELLQYFLVLAGYSILFVAVSYYKFVKTELRYG